MVQNARRAIFLALFLVASTASAQAQTPPYYGRLLEEFAHNFVQYEFSIDPVGATDAGLHTADTKLDDFSPAADLAYQQRLRDFRNELVKLVPQSDASPHDQVNYLLLRSQIEGAWFSEFVLKANQRNPTVYEGLCSEGIFSLIKKPFASEDVRLQDAIARMHACRTVLAQGKANLTDPVREFAQVASQDIAQGDGLYTTSLNVLAEHASPARKAELKAAQTDVLSALHDFKAWIDANQSSWHSGGFAVGKEMYDWYLRRVELLPYTGEQMAAMGGLELARVRALESWEDNRQKYDHSGVTQPAFTSKAAFLHYYEGQTAKLRAFIASHAILTVPPYLGAFRIVEVPKALATEYPGGFANPPGVFDSDPSGFYFVTDFNPKNTSFFAAQARQSVMPVLGHEGIPGHFMQFSIAYHNPDYIRHTATTNFFSEGWAFYSEEMLMRSGLYDDNPAARRAVIHLMRHRATRVGVDVGLNSGTATLPQAISYFMTNAGIDHDTAYGEATRFAMIPGQGSSYFIGKTQIETLLGLVRDHDGARFSLRTFHDRLLSYGTVPLSTLRYEWLGDPAWLSAVREPLEPVSF